MSDEPPSVFGQAHCQVTRTFSLPNNKGLTISSQFDSGNIEILKQISPFEYRLSSVFDNENSAYKSNSKSWFHFSVQLPAGSKCRFVIEKVQCLTNVIDSGVGHVYRPVVKENGGWRRLGTECRLAIRPDQIVEIDFEHVFQCGEAHFAFCYPWSYQQNIEYIQQLDFNKGRSDFYYHQQVLIQSPQKRDIHLLTITSHSENSNEFEARFSDHLFPHNDRPFRFNKSVVLISARVHPGETPASYSMKGIINFLTSQDLRACMLREMFVFMIVPMINVDGVFRGNFRMDVFGQNLNRYYIDPDVEKQQVVFGIKKLAEHLHSTSRLSFYFDLHAHNSKKGCFIYGNAIDNFVDQVESNTFCKLVSLNTKFFEEEECTFSTKHMKIKDKFEDLTKEGCARVVMHKLTGIIHSYSLECGLISSNVLNELPEPANLEYQFDGMGLTRDSLEENNNQLFSRGPPLYTQEMYENVGKALMVSILDTFDKNPYSRVPNSTYNSLPNIRRFVAFEIFHQAERFRMFEKNTFMKVKHINSLMMENFKEKFSQRTLNIQGSGVFGGVKWPANIPGLQIQEEIFKVSPCRKDRTKDKLGKGSRKSSKCEKVLAGKSDNAVLHKTSRSELTSTAIESTFGIDPLQFCSSQSQAKCITPVVPILLDVIDPKTRVSSETNSKDPELKLKIKREMKEELRMEIKGELRMEIYEELYPFGDRNLRLDGSSADDPKSFRGEGGLKSANLPTHSREKKNISQRVSRLKKALSKRDKDSQGSIRLAHIHESLNKFYMEIKTSINAQYKVKKGAPRIQSYHSDMLISSSKKLDQRTFQVRCREETKRYFRLPRINNTQKLAPNSFTPLDTVERDLINDSCQNQSSESPQNLHIDLRPLDRVMSRIKRARG